MAHVTFIHGMANKPPEADLLRLWRDAIARSAEPMPLGELGVSSALVYWADLLYDKPEEDLSAFEGVLENSPQAVDGAGGAAAPQPRTEEEAAFLAGLRAKMTTRDDGEIEAAPDAVQPQGREQNRSQDQGQGQDQNRGQFERVPLPWFIKKRVLDAFLRDVHHYLFDVEFAPPGGQPVRVRQAVRQRFLDALCAPAVTRPHVVVAHSLGTVVAYDCLKQVSGCQPIDGLITLGSPLGLDEVQDKLRPGWSRADGFPHTTLHGQWVNLFDRLDPVCGFDPALGNDFRMAGEAAILDAAVQNDGAWRHSITKYLRQRAFGQALRRMLDIED